MPSTARCANTPLLREHQYLLAGPWHPHPLGRSRRRHLTSVPNANLDTDAIHLRWFNHWLRKILPRPGLPTSRAYVTSRWAKTSGTPSETDHQILPTSFTLHLGQARQRVLKQRRTALLTPDRPTTDEAPDIFSYDPGSPRRRSGRPRPCSPARRTRLLCSSATTCSVYTTPNRSLRRFTSSAARKLSTLHFATTSVPQHRPRRQALFCLAPLLATGTFRSASASLRSHLASSLTSAIRTPSAPVDGHARSHLRRPGNRSTRLRLESLQPPPYPLFDRNPNNDTPPRDADVAGQLAAVDQHGLSRRRQPPLNALHPAYGWG